jgi:two-component system, chemotaxis family, response regulator Rcp1
MTESNGLGTAPFDVLLVEDSPGDVRLIQEAFRDANCNVRLHVASDGVEAMAFLQSQSEGTNRARPDLILLDLNLPKKDGRSVLAELKEDPTLKTIPVVILTTSGEHEDIKCSYLLHANCYITKPVELQGFLDVVTSVYSFWLTVVKLPNHPPERSSAMKEHLR